MARNLWLKKRVRRWMHAIRWRFRLLVAARQELPAITAQSAAEFLFNHYPVTVMPQEYTAVNDNCFWKWLLGPHSHFEFAAEARKRLETIKMEAREFVTEQDLRCIEENQLVLDLFRAIYIDQSVQQAAALAPKLNQYIPQLMMSCPDESLRPPSMAE